MRSILNDKFVPTFPAIHHPKTKFAAITIDVTCQRNFFESAAMKQLLAAAQGRFACHDAAHKLPGAAQNRSLQTAASYESRLIHQTRPAEPRFRYRHNKGPNAVAAVQCVRINALPAFVRQSAGENCRRRVVSFPRTCLNIPDCADARAHRHEQTTKCHRLPHWRPHLTGRRVLARFQQPTRPSGAL